METTKPWRGRGSRGTEPHLLMPALLALFCAATAGGAALAAAADTSTGTASPAAVAASPSQAAAGTASPGGSGAPAGADQQPAQQQPTGAAAASCDTSRLQVTGAGLPGETLAAGQAAQVRRGDRLVVSISGLDQLLAQPACRTKKLLLYLDGQAIPDPVALGGEGSPRSALFSLDPTPASGAAWSALLASPTFKGRDFLVNAGIEGGDVFAAGPEAIKIHFTLLDRGRVAAWAVLLVLAAVAFFVLAAKTELLRAGPLPGPGMRRPFSLSRTQAAWWLFIILGSYLLIGLVTGDYLASINSTALVLLGISAGTAVGAATVDSAQQDAAGQLRRAEAMTEAKTEVAAAALAAKDAAQQAQAAAVQAPAGGGQPPAAAQEVLDAKALLADKLSRLKAARNETETFWIDILSDADGVSVHRFQNVVWTVVLGLIFAIQAWTHLVMPTYDGSLLALMGISAATYVGMKIPEAKVPSAPAG